MPTTIQLKRAASPGAAALAEGEPAFTTGQNRLYIGDTDDGNAPMACRMKLDGTAAPGATEDADDGFSVGSIWCDTTNDKAYVCVDATAAAAVWTEITAGAGSSPPFADTQTIIKGSADATKLLRFEIDGLTTGTTRVLTPQDADYTLENTGHASKHVSGGSDSIKLDDLAAPDDNTDLNASALSHGLLRKLDGSTTNFLRGDGTWNVPASTLDIDGLTAGDIDALDYVPSRDTSLSANRKVTVARHMGYAPCVPGGRLSTEAGVSVSTSDRTGQLSVYWVPCYHRWVPIYDATRWTAWDVASYSTLSLGTLTSGKNYDVVFFILSGSGVPAIDLIPAWTNDTTRASGVTYLNGILVNTSSFTSVVQAEVVPANCATVVGTIRTTSTTTTEDSDAKRFVWNLYNREPRRLKKSEATNTWNWSTASYQQANGSAANQVECVCGIAGLSQVDLAVRARMASNATTFVPKVSIGEDGTTPHADAIPGTMSIALTTVTVDGLARLIKPAALGYHYYTWLEKGAGTGIQTWYGDDGDSTLVNSSIFGPWDC